MTLHLNVVFVQYFFKTIKIKLANLKWKTKILYYRFRIYIKKVNFALPFVASTVCKKYVLNR